MSDPTRKEEQMDAKWLPILILSETDIRRLECRDGVYAWSEPISA